MLVRRGLPRLEMGLIVGLTGLAAFATSVAVLRAGVSSMTLRYPIAVLGGYVAFLTLLRLWIWLKRNKDDDADFDIDTGGSDSEKESDAGGDVDLNAGDVSSADASGLDIAGDELVFVIVLIAAVAGMALAVAFVIYQAPILLAELLVDGAVMAGLYRRVGMWAESVWLESAVKRTWKPLLAILLIAMIVGFCLSALGPGQPTAGAALRAWWNDDDAPH